MSRKPHQNDRWVKTYARCALPPEDEIHRLLKVINKRTTLFPTVRSVLVGYYTHIEEANEESLSEVINFVFSITANDDGGSVMNAQCQSARRQHRALEGCWSTLVSDCGEPESAKDPVHIPVFRSGLIAYEFVCYPRLLEQLAERPDARCWVEVAQQEVMALRDIAELRPLLRLRGGWPYRSEDYLRYRAPELCSVLSLVPEIVEPPSY